MLDDWRHLFACPVCSAPLENATRCEGCGENYASVDGTPRLVSPKATTTVSFEFSSPRSVVPDDVKQRVLRRPAATSLRDLPYHMDPAHADALTRLAKGSLVLEIGCGGGQNRTWATAQGLKYLGTDASKTRVYAHLQAHGGPDLLADAHFLPLRNECVDCVYAAAVNEHLACPVRAAQEARRVLRPGGLFLANGSFMEPWHDESFFHMSPNGVIEMLTAAGLEIECVFPSKGWHGFKAMPRMAYFGLMRKLWPLGSAMHALYRAQIAMANVRRRIKGKPPHNDMITESRVAGAIVWIARKPA